MILLSSVQLSVLAGDGPAPASDTLLREIRDAPESIKINNAVLRLNANLWRDFMPTICAAEPCRPMLGRLRVAAESRKSISLALHADKVWLIQGAQVWESYAIAQRTDDSALEFEIRDGPGLEPGSRVDVVVRLFDNNGKIYWLAVHRQSVNKAV
jgi:hypothetical protein